MDETSRNGTCSQSGRQSVSQSAGNQKEEMDQQSPSASDAAPTETRLSAANNKKVDGFLGGRKKGGDHVQSSVWRIAH